MPQGLVGPSFGTIRGTATTAWLEYVSLDLSSEELLWPWTRAKHYELSNKFVKSSKLDKTGITPASGRAGGATHYYLAGMSLETLSFLGRWTVLSSLRSYIQEGGAKLVWASLATDRQKEVSVTVSHYREVVAGPPPIPFTEWG